MTDIDISPAAVARMSAMLRGQDGMPLPWRMEVADTHDALAAERDALHADLARLKQSETDAINEVERLRAIMSRAHAVMRECGWQLAIAAEPQGDGILEAACTEIEAEFAEVLKGGAQC